MNDLAITIEYLLLGRNSVIVPGLGAFTTRTFASQWLEDEEVFLPPVRHIRFNADVFQDPEEFFLNALSEIYGLTPEEAQQRCEEMVSDFHKALVTEGTIDFGSIGLFTLEDDAEIIMSPYECGVTSPDYYGLDTMHFPLLANLPANEANSLAGGGTAHAVKAEDNTQPSQTANVGNEEDAQRNIVLPKERTYVADSKHIIIRLNRAFVHYTMVTAASVLLFFLLSPNVMDRDAASQVNLATTNVLLNTSKNTDKKLEVPKVANVRKESETQLLAVDSTSLVPANETESLTSSSRDEGIEIVVEDNVLKVIPSVKSEDKEEVNNSQIFNKLQGQFSIVLASSITQKNAEAFVEHLRSRDIHAIIYDNGKMLRVVIDGFASQADAYNVNNYLHKLDKDLSSTWVMKN